MTDEIVTRLYRALVEELERRDHPEGRPVKVSELYHDLVPYQSVRSDLGVELNADYEHALLRLLSGERDLLRLEPAQARDELRREVEAPYPFVGLFRKFSASNVWVKMPARPEAEPAGTEQASSPEPETTTEEAPGPERAGTASGGKAPAPAEPAASESAPSAPAPVTDHPHPQVAAEAPRDVSSPAAGRSGGVIEGRGGAAAERAPVQLHPDREHEPGRRRSDPGERMIHAGQDCAFCSEALPEGRRVRFCPHCGGDQRLRPCPRCDAVLERGWLYCISCGHEVAAD